ncbi:unnamed protein product [Caenorhabditis bovis]|uniref:Uncharacterized protein n=1 Tax=Caenorhabditis bovis TaxID=2654633 RepID=A0A8S1FDB2_9PELO|nr:unnamed protein product [Caenorhabditis bovis]
MSVVDAAKNTVNELRLNVTSFYQDPEARNLLQSEEAARTLADSDVEDYLRNERVYECVIGSSVCRLARSSMLALSLFCTIAIAVVIITIVLLCTFYTLATPSQVPDDISNEDVIGVINWLHYPIGDLALRRLNHTKYH